MTKQGFTVGQVAEAAGVGVETVRFYERKGLIQEPPRPGSGHRRYPPETVGRLQFIRAAQNLGFSLKEIDELLALRVAPGVDKWDIKTRAEAKVAEIERKMSDLQRMRDTLIKVIGLCEGSGPLDDCPILEAFDHPTGVQRPTEPHAAQHSAAPPWETT